MAAAEKPSKTRDCIVISAHAGTAAVHVPSWMVPVGMIGGLSLAFAYLYLMWVLVLGYKGKHRKKFGAMAQLVAHFHGMEGVRGSNPRSSTWGVGEG